MLSSRAAMAGPALLEDASVSSSWPPVIGRTAVTASRSPKTAPFCSPDSHWRQPYDYPSEYETLTLKINPPRVVVDNTTDPDSTLVKVDSANRHGCLLEVVQVLTDLDLVISKAYISSDGGWFVDVFHVKDQLGNKVVDEGLIDYIQSVLGAKREASVQEVKTCLGRPVNIQGALDHTAIELTGVDRPGLLSEISAVITHFGCNVAGAEVWTHSMRVACIVYITDRATGGPIQDALLLASLKEQLRQVMKADGGRSASKTDFAIGLTHTERRLHQMMFADRDYDNLGSKSENMTSPSVSVRNCGETMYSVVSVKCRDRPKLLFDTVCTLTDMQYTVFHATIDSSEEIATQEYYIRNKEGFTLDSEAERERVIKCLEAAIERRTPEGLRLELRTGDRVGLLSDVTRIFRENGLQITKADVATQGEEAVNVFYVTDANGKPVDMKVVEAMRQEIGDTVLQVKDSGYSNRKAPVDHSKPADKSGPSFVHMLRSHSERWLLSLGLGLGGSSQNALSPSSPSLSSNGGRGLAASTRW